MAGAGGTAGSTAQAEMRPLEQPMGGDEDEEDGGDDADGAAEGGTCSPRSSAECVVMASPSTTRSTVMDRRWQPSS